MEAVKEKTIAADDAVYLTNFNKSATLYEKRNIQDQLLLEKNADKNEKKSFFV